MPYQILDYKDVPNPIAKKILEQYLSKLSSLDVTAEPARSALEYLQIVNVCDPDRAEQLVERLRELNLSNISITLIVNIAPKTIDELKMLLTFEPVMPEEDRLGRVLELVEEYCR